jgi:hypothetical protein
MVRALALLTCVGAAWAMGTDYSKKVIRRSPGRHAVSVVDASGLANSMTVDASMLSQETEAHRDLSLGNSLEEGQARSTSIPSIFPDGATELQPVVTKMTSGFAYESLLSFDVTSNPLTISLDRAEVTIEVAKDMQASYIRRWYDADGTIDWEFGVSKQKYFAQPMGSALSNKANAGLAEKMHGVVRKKDVQAAQPSSPISGPTPELLQTRNTLTMAQVVMGRPGTQGIHATGIPNADIAGFSKTTEPFAASDTLKDLLNKEHAKVADSKFGEPQFTSFNCFHWEGAIINSSHITFKLDSKLPSYAGQTLSAPSQSYEILQGTSMWSYDHTTHKIELHFGASLKSKLGYDSFQVTTSPIDGKAGPAVEASGVNPVSFRSRAVAAALGANASKIPADNTFLFADPERLCTTQQLQKIGSHTASLPAIVQKLMTGAGGQETVLQFSAAAADFLLCSTNIVKPDSRYIYGATYDIFMASAFAHAMMEVPPAFYSAVLFARDWQTYSVDSFKGHTRCNEKLVFRGGQETWAGSCMSFEACQRKCRELSEFSCSQVNWWPHAGGCRLQVGGTIDRVAWDAISGRPDCIKPDKPDEFWTTQPQSHGEWCDAKRWISH